MTREEQLDWLCRLRSGVKIYMPIEWVDHFEDALTESIKALSQEQSSEKWLNVRTVLLSENDRQKSGEWIRSLIYENTFNCSKCGSAGYDTFNYCPNCGAKMENAE